MAANANRAEIDGRYMVVSRLIDAPRALVYEMFTDPKHLAVWWGPSGFTTTTSAHALEADGMWRFVMHGPDGTDYQNRIVYEEVVPGVRLAYRHDDGGGCNRFQSVITFADEDGKTRVTLTADFESAEEAQRVAGEFGALEGGSQTLDRLSVYVSGVAAGRKN